MRPVGDFFARTFRSLRNRNFRLYFVNQLVSMSGIWMQSVAQGWLVLQLTGSAFILGVTVALQFGPVLVLGPWGGVLADRTDKRRLLLVTQALLAALAMALGLVTLAGVVEVWMVLVLAGLNGVVMAIDNPARQAFVYEMVGPDDVANAVGLNSVIINASRIVGPALAAVLIATVGLAPCFLANAASYLFIIAAFVAMRPRELHRGAPLERAGGQVRAGLRYVWHAPRLLVPLAMMAVVSTLGYNFAVLLPLLARYAFDRGGEAYGALMTAMGVGALAGSFLAAAVSRPTWRLLVAATLSFGVFTLLVAAAPGFGTALALLVPMGAAAVVFVSTTNSLLQLNAATEMRGRVMALWGVVFFGSTPVGGPLAGLLAGRYGPRVALAVGGVATLATGAAACWGLRRRSLSTHDV